MGTTRYIRIEDQNAKAQMFAGALKQMEKRDPALKVATAEVSGAKILSFDVIGLEKATLEKIGAAASDAGLSLTDSEPLTPEEKFAR
jgi:hypothetical protein